MEEKWMAIFQNLQEKDVEWKTPWMVPDEILYQCRNFGWVPLLGIWGAVGYTPLLVLRQYRSRQFIPITQGPAQCEFSYKEHLQVVPSELEIIKQDFEKRSLELGRKIEQLEEEKMRLGLDVDIHKLEAKKLRKGKNKAEEDLNSLKTDYKKLCLSIRTAGLGKTAEQWQQEIKEEKTRAKQRERNFTTPEPERLRASLGKIEELKGRIEDLEDALQNSELRVELLERHNEQCQEQLHHS
ncbi:hypothetical protein Golax_025995 [Gossypium laxum]|uniref:DUF7745 domain-containing protein n=1 Tax=Gossypium laxum TaxID=34288 RepID=A0A7J9AZR5_9ROSI|nr:hypothetical protein [Gossypium laxum]